MKKYTLIIMLLLFTATAAHAQSVVSTISINEKVKVEKTKIKKEKQPKDWWANPLQQGYRGFVEAGVITSFDEIGFNLSTSHGYQINRWLYLGGGAGFEGITYWDSGMVMAIPVFADVRAYMTGTKVKPFFDVQIGYKISCNSVEDVYVDTLYKIGHLHASIGFGIEYKRLSVKLACNPTKILYMDGHMTKWESYLYEFMFGIGLGVNF